MSLPTLRSLRSMTGFARAAGALDGYDWAWELKAVNGKGCDVRFRLPHGCEALELPAKKLITASVARGNIQVTLALGGPALTAVPVINHAALAAVVEAANAASVQANGLRPASVGELLALRGVLDMAAPASSQDHASLRPEAAILATLSEALDQLNAVRVGEGQALQDVLTAHIDQIAALHERAVAEPSRSPEALQARLQSQLGRITGAVSDADLQFDPDRIHQELALLATRADISEELDRLAAHCEAARALLSSAEPVGRRLDFLAQEFNREANTLCSKSHSSGLTEIGLELKVVIDQFREQALNIE
ncbi:MAG: YicC/YloC family endoribonuclease [Pseudomonadota bacterium]